MEYLIKIPMFSICPSGHRSSFGRPVEVYMKSELHIDVHWKSRGRLKPTGAKPNCINLVLTSKEEIFKNSNVLAAGISHHRSFIVTALKSQFIKGNAKIKLYRDYSSFQMEMFKADLDLNLKCTTGFEYSDFQSTFTRVLHNHAPIKKKILRFNNSPFMTKTLRKAIMHRSKLKNIYNKKRTNDNWANYAKQRNYCVNLLRKTKKDYFHNLNIRDLSDNRKFWKTIEPHFTNKRLTSTSL